MENLENAIIIKIENNDARKQSMILVKNQLNTYYIITATNSRSFYITEIKGERLAYIMQE